MERILIIEDDDAIAKLEKDYLEINNFEVVVEKDGRQGLKRGLEENFDMFILDLMIPTIDGFEVCKQLRAVKNTPIIMISARKDDIDKIKGLGLGADDYITKPFSPSEVVARVKAHLSRYERLINAEAEDDISIINIRGLKIEKEMMRVSVHGEEKQLSAKEYELLLYLAEHPNTVVTKEELFRAVWREGHYGDISTVTVHIKRVREKIEVDSGNPQYIETIWGVGYRFRM